MDRTPSLEAERTSRVLIVIVAWEHLETTTRPCLDSLLRYTDDPCRVVCVDNGSRDATSAFLREAARRDGRVLPVRLHRNLGWAGGSLRGLQELRREDGSFCLLNSDTLELDYRFDYTMYGQFMKFIRPGAVRIDSNLPTRSLPNVAVRNPDGTVTLVVANPKPSEQSFDIEWQGQHATARIEGQSVVTYCWR